MNTTESEYRWLVSFYGENPDVIESTSFFAIFRTFVNNVQYMQKLLEMRKKDKQYAKQHLSFDVMVQPLKKKTDIDQYFETLKNELSVNVTKV